MINLFQPGERILIDSDDNESSQRQTWIVISTPGLNEWAKEGCTKATNNVSSISTAAESSLNSSYKRSFEETDEPMDVEPSKKKEKTCDNLDAGSSKMQEDSNISKIVSRDHILNFPIPNKDGKACIVKVSLNIKNYFIQIFQHKFKFFTVNYFLTRRNSFDFLTIKN